jgi:hypothetical protein
MIGDSAAATPMRQSRSRYEASAIRLTRLQETKRNTSIRRRKDQARLFP